MNNTSRADKVLNHKAQPDGNACKCGRAAIYLRIQEGAHYCGRCLSRQIERNFEKTIAKEKMINKGDVVAVAVSGGKDSMTLLYLMQKLSSRVPIKIVAVTIDEGIEGYRDKSIEKMDEFVKNLGIEHRIFSYKDEFDVSIDELKNVKHCTYCGVFRRTLLNKAAREVGATKLAVGHNLDDEAQSILMNVMRGDVTRMERLSQSFQRKKLAQAGVVRSDDQKSNMFIPRIKPLKNILEKEIVVYSIENNIPYYDGECPNSFNNVRRDAQRMINEFESKYPGTKNQIIRFHRKIKPNLPQTEGMISYCIKCDEPSSHEVCKACELLSRIKNV